MEAQAKELWQFYRAEPTTHNRNRLVEHYMGLVEMHARRLYSTMPRSVELDDLVQAGVFGLISAVEGFEPERAYKFETYSALRIRGSILDAVRAMDWVPRTARKIQRRLVAASRELEAFLGREPTPAELAGRLGQTEEEFRQFSKAGSPVFQTSLEAVLKKARKGWTREFSDRRLDNPYARLQRLDSIECLFRFIGRRDRLILVSYYFEGQTMRQISKALGLSESRVSMLHAEILKRLAWCTAGRACGIHAE